MTVDELLDRLRTHQQTHTDWAVWFEKHPDDERYKSVGDAGFHRMVERSYSEMLETITEMDRLIKQEQHIGSHIRELMDQLWSDVFGPEYGDWEYPGQWYRHLSLRFKELSSND